MNTSDEITQETEESAMVKTGAEMDLEKEEQKPTVYAWFVLFVVFMVRAIHQLHRQCIGFAFGFQGLGDKFNNPKYMIGAQYP